MAKSMEAMAKNLGIPMEVIIDNDTRQNGCDAHAATLVSIEGKLAIYAGQCSMGHHYEFRREIQEMQKGVHIENGELVIGQGKNYEADDLEEY